MESRLLMCRCCMSLAHGAHESECCGLLYCEDCTKTNIQCPKCEEENVLFRPNLFVEKLIDSGDVLTTQWVQQPGFDPAIPLVNENGNTCRLGQSGKYYCGQPMECNHSLSGQHTNCQCPCCQQQSASKICGPSYGCNCQPCQKLDIALRGLPKGWLVAPDGTIARWCGSAQGPGQGRFSCGRRHESVARVERSNWIEKFSLAIKGKNDILNVQYCSVGKSVCPSCVRLYEHIIFGNQYRAILGLPEIDLVTMRNLNGESAKDASKRQTAPPRIETE